MPRLVSVSSSVKSKHAGFEADRAAGRCLDEGRLHPRLILVRRRDAHVARRCIRLSVEPRRTASSGWKSLDDSLHAEANKSTAAMSLDRPCTSPQLRMALAMRASPPIVHASLRRPKQRRHFSMWSGSAHRLREMWYGRPEAARPFAGDDIERPTRQRERFAPGRRVSRRGAGIDLRFRHGARERRGTPRVLAGAGGDVRQADRRRVERFPFGVRVGLLHSRAEPHHRRAVLERIATICSPSP